MYGFWKAHWVACAGVTGGALLLLTPLVYDVWPLGLTLIFLHSPGYMIHQVEEHAGDRFRAFVNQRLFAGREALTTLGVLWVNVGAVWGIDLAALYVARAAGPGWALAAPYLMIVNAISHIAAAARFGDYNPGLVTSFVIFLPLGLTALWTIPATWAQHLVGLAFSLGVHAAVVLTVAAHLRSLRRSAGAQPLSLSNRP